MKKLYLVLTGLITGLVVGVLLAIWPMTATISIPILSPQKQVVGFLPFGLLDKANLDYSKYLTTLDYFALTVDKDGTILKLNNPQEEEPGWYTLNSGKADQILNQMKQKGVKLSLVVYSSNDDNIYPLISDPLVHAQNLIADVTPIMQKYDFSDLNLDIESPKEVSSEARTEFTRFTSEVKKGLDKNKLGSLTVDISPTAFIKNYLIDPSKVATLANYILVMAYDYHYQGSIVTGSVAPLYGAGSESEFDTNAAIKTALGVVPKNKLILGLPLYGYEWETLTDFPRSATIPGSSLIISNNRAEQFLESCASCSAKLDPLAQEKYLVYQDQDTGTFYQAFFPDQSVTKTKLDYAKKMDLGGVGFWALGFEDGNILTPLQSYK